jgi:hypothetical protein
VILSVRDRRARTALLVAAAIAAAAVPLVVTPDSHGFGTINGLGQAAEHERITRVAFACPAGQPSNGRCFEPDSLDELAGEDGEFGAVGSPDNPINDDFSDPAAHCDDADFMDVAGYPRTRAQATAQLQACVNHLQGRFEHGLASAPDMIDGDEIVWSETTLIFGCFFNGQSGRAKCDALEGFGRALHGAQDFYSHSNWTDRADPNRPISTVNPRGLRQVGPTTILDLRAETDVSALVPREFTTGCYILDDESPGVDECANRVTHASLNKDRGDISTLSGEATNPRTPRGQVSPNFQNAVTGAIRESRLQWANFRQQLIALYGARDGNRMICALTRDDPSDDCEGNLVAFVLDGSGSTARTDPDGLRLKAAAAINANLLGDAEVSAQGRPDRSTVIGFDRAARVLSPLDDPAKATFSGVGASGGTSVAGGIRAALKELNGATPAVARAKPAPSPGATSDAAESKRSRRGMVVFSDGLDNDLDAQLAAVAAAREAGVRVTLGLLSPPASTTKASAARAGGDDGGRGTADPRESAAVPWRLVDAILDTGGLVATLDSAKSLDAFAELVTARGATGLTDPGIDIGGPIGAGMTVYLRAEAGAPPGRFRAKAAAGQRLTVTVRAVSGGAVRGALTDIRRRTSYGDRRVDGTTRFSASLGSTADLDLIVSAAGSSPGVYAVTAAPAG